MQKGKQRRTAGSGKERKGEAKEGQGWIREQGMVAGEEAMGGSGKGRGEMEGSFRRQLFLERPDNDTESAAILNRRPGKVLEGSAR